MANLNIVYQETTKLIPYARNSRTHSDEQVAQICASIKEFGWTNPILIDEDDGIIAGHGRLLAAQRLSEKQVPTIRLEGLTEAQKKAYVIADNKLALNAGWNEEMLAIEMEDLNNMDFDLSLLGFSDDEINNIIYQEDQEGLVDDDEVPEVEENPISQKGNVWLLGEHKVISGSSIEAADVQKLMQTDKVDMMFTDPPYNVDYGGSKNPKYIQRSIKNDKMPEEHFKEFLYNFIEVSKNHTKAGAPYYIAYGERNALQFLSSFKKAGLAHSCNIIWKKQTLVLGRSDYHYIHEPIFYGWIDGQTHIYYGDRKQTSVWEVDRPTKSELHPTMKPVELVLKAIHNSSKAGDIVYDPFGGSGSTLIAAEKSGRAARIVELDNKYVDVIVKRWQQYTGKQAILDGDGRTFEEIENGETLQDKLQANS